MQTPNLPIQVNSAAPAPQAQRGKTGNAEGNGQFGQALAREIDARKGAMIAPPAPQAQAKAAPARPQGSAQPQQSQAAQAGKSADKAAAPANSAGEKAPGKASAKTDSAESAEAADSAAAAAAASQAEANPVVDMLNLVASFNQPAAAVAGEAAPAADPLLAGAARHAAAGMTGESAPALPPAAKTQGAAQLLADAAPGLSGEDAAAPAAPFANMMARADGSVLDEAQPAADAGLDGALASERPAPQGAAERILPGKPDAGSAVPGQLRGAAEALPGAGLRAREMAAEVSQIKDMQVNAPATAPLQQAVLQAAQAVHGPVAGDRIPARVGTPAWDQQVAQKIVWMVGGEEQSASLTLNPPDLGPMQVVLSVTNDMASVTFSSSQLEVRQALEDAMPKLREMMSENGIALGDANVNDGAPEQQQPAEQQTRRGGGAQRADNGPVNGSAAEAEARNNARPARVGQAPGMVDTFA